MDVVYNSYIHFFEVTEMKTYLFDFDGTLVDSMPVYAGVMKQILDENNISYGDDFIKIITPLGVKGTAEYCINELKLNMTFEEFCKTAESYFYEEYANNIPAKNNVIETLKKLKEQGACLNVLTASPHLTLDACLKRLGLFELFENVWSCDDFDTTKADPEIYRMAAGKLGVPVNEVLFLDDNYNADKTAKTAGMKVCGVYDESSADSEDEIRSITDFYIKDFSELLDVCFS